MHKSLYWFKPSVANTYNKLRLQPLMVLDNSCSESTTAINAQTDATTYTCLARTLHQLDRLHLPALTPVIHMAVCIGHPKHWPFGGCWYCCCISSNIGAYAICQTLFNHCNPFPLLICVLTGVNYYSSPIAISIAKSSRSMLSGLLGFKACCAK
eukprot:GHRR01037371.1.p1 GENE.GHRR01037371.1~~GHRR01037371.1.p1  ORF type:complete len:154 (+),score=2.22 GHRR01037371.1:106-567(+)